MGDAFEHGLAMLLFLLHHFPQFQRILRVFRCGRGLVSGLICLEDVRMAGDELIYETVAHFVDVERILRINGAHLRLENGLQQHVAEFFTHVVAIVRFHSVDVFVGFFQQWFKQACIGLLAVPRASAWFVQNAYNLLDAIQRARSISYRVKFRTVLEFFGQLIIVMCSFSHTADSSRMCRPCSCGRKADFYKSTGIGEPPMSYTYFWHFTSGIRREYHILIYD